jgi:hypothetical protein
MTNPAPTHSVNLNVVVNSTEQWTEIFSHLADVAASLPQKYSGVSVSSFQLADEDEVIQTDPDTEYYDDQTLMKVRNVLRLHGITDDVITDIISEMQNVGLLFRERR